MKKYAVYFGFIEFVEGKIGKKRPVILIELLRNQKSIYTFPVYSYKKWFDKSLNEYDFFEILDIGEAGLDKRSFIDFNRPYTISLNELKLFKLIGHLSNTDIKRIVEKLNAENG